MQCDLPNVYRVTPSTRIRFRCTGCGACCKHVKETVPVDSLDVFRLTRHLRDSGQEICFTDQFLSEYAVSALLNEDGYFVYFLKSVGADDTCIFLKDNRCTVQAAKPRACRLYPFMVEPNESGDIHYLYSREREHHFHGPVVETKSWMKKNLHQEDRAFLRTDYAGTRPIATLLRQIPDSRKTEAVLQFHRLRYSEYDLDKPFLEQFSCNQEKLLRRLAAMAE